MLKKILIFIQMLFLIDFFSLDVTKKKEEMKYNH